MRSQEVRRLPEAASAIQTQSSGIAALVPKQRAASFWESLFPGLSLFLSAGLTNAREMHWPGCSILSERSGPCVIGEDLSRQAKVRTGRARCRSPASRTRGRECPRRGAF